ncbi:MAG: hypothetical protein IPN36_18500 [Bacteroidetes bacterium]|nr:hypothetical protein [Bacteroidota bacterium]
MKKSFLIFILLLTSVVVNAQNNAYGDNQKQVEPGVWAIYSGDINQDGTIDIFDQVELDNDLSNFASGYVLTDLNGDSTVDIFDQVILDNNLANFVSAITPLNGFRVMNPAGGTRDQNTGTN